MVDEDFRRQIAGEKAGAAIKFTDIDGIGPATAKKIKNAGQTRRSIQAPRDVADMSADELSDKAGISRDRARKAISGGGGNPGVSKLNNTGSVSAAGIKMPVGEFLVEAGDDDKARAKNDTFSRSKEAIRQDDRKRAPITTDVDKWENNKSGLDFPGVDTPTQNPKVLPKDLKQQQKPRTTEPDEQSQAEQTSGFDDRRLKRTIDGETVYSEQVVEEGPSGRVPGFAPSDVGLPGASVPEKKAAFDRGIAPEDQETPDGKISANNFWTDARGFNFEAEEPPETGLARQRFGASKYLDERDNSPQTIAEYYESGDIDIGLSEFAARVRSKKRRSDIPLDMYAASDEVGKELGAFPAYRD